MRISTLFSCQYLILNFPHRVCTYENIDLLTIAHCFLIRYAHMGVFFFLVPVGNAEPVQRVSLCPDETRNFDRITVDFLLHGASVHDTMWVRQVKFWRNYDLPRFMYFRTAYNQGKFKIPFYRQFCCIFQRRQMLCAGLL